MATKLTKVQAAAGKRNTARHVMRKAASEQIVLTTIQAQRPDMDCGDLPPWFASLVGQCGTNAVSEAVRAVHNNDAYQSAVGEEARAIAFHEAYIPAYALVLPKLLAKALANHAGLYPVD